MWSLALDAYYWDRLDQAHELCATLGAGDAAYGIFVFRMIEAEWLTRQQAKAEQLDEWLTVEADPKEVKGDIGELHTRIRQGIAEVRRRIGWDESVPVWVTILADECNTPWTPGRHGFCVDKHPFDKICLPSNLTGNPLELVSAVRHEFAHVASLNLSRGRVPSWLDEAIAMQMGGELDPDAARFLVEDDAWLGPRDLDEAFGEDREDEEGREIVWMAYQQCALIGRYLAEQKGEAFLGGLLRALAPGSVLAELKMRMLGQTPADRSLKRLAAVGEEELFEQVYDAYCARFE